MNLNSFERLENIPQSLSTSLDFAQSWSVYAILPWIDSLIEQKRGTHLSSLEKSIINGIWLNQTDKSIADDSGYSARYLNQKANELFDLLEKIFNQRVTKKGVYGLKPLLEREYAEHIKKSEEARSKSEVKNRKLTISAIEGGNSYRSDGKKLESIYPGQISHPELHSVNWSQSKIANHLTKPYCLRLVLNVKRLKRKSRTKNLLGGYQERSRGDLAESREAARQRHLEEYRIQAHLFRRFS